MSDKKYAETIGVKLGKNVFISTRNWGSEPYLISIGDNCQITHNVYFYTHGGSHIMRNTEPDFDAFGKISVEEGVYIGACSLIMPGVTLGKGSLIAAGSIVTRSVPPGVVVGGNPAKFICSVEEYISKNRKYNMHTYGLSPGEKKKRLLVCNSDMFIKR